MTHKKKELYFCSYSLSSYCHNLLRVTCENKREKEAMMTAIIVVVQQKESTEVCMNIKKIFSEIIFINLETYFICHKIFHPPAFCCFF